MVKKAHSIQYYDQAKLFLLVLTLAQKVWSSIYPNSETNYAPRAPTPTRYRYFVQSSDVGSCLGTEDAFVQPTTELGKHREHSKLCESLVWRENIQLRATVMKSIQTTPLNRQMYLFCCNPNPRAQAGSSDHRQN